MNWLDDDSVDQLLRDGLSSRSMPESPGGLAQRAIMRAAQLRQQGVLNELERKWVWGLRINLVAGAIVVALAVAVLFWLYPSNDTSILDSAISATDLVSDSSASLSFGLGASDRLLMAGAGLLGVVLLLTIELALSANPGRLSLSLQRPGS